MNIDEWLFEQDGRCCPICKSSTFVDVIGTRVCHNPDCDFLRKAKTDEDVARLQEKSEDFNGDRISTKDWVPVLKPCPLCGGEASFTKTNSTIGAASPDLHYIMCEDCYCCTEVFPIWDRTVVDVWNKRVVEEKLQQRIAELEEENPKEEDNQRLQNALDFALAESACLRTVAKAARLLHSDRYEYNVPWEVEYARREKLLKKALKEWDSLTKDGK